MLHQLIAAVDGDRARFFTVGRRSTPQGEKRTLHELEGLENPALPADARSEDDRHERSHAHSDAVEKRFATQVLARLVELMRDKQAERVILAAPPRMLGFLRSDKTRLPEAAVWVLPKHLTELSAHDLCARLEKEQLLAD